MRDLDYLRDEHGIIYLVKGDHHPADGVRAYPVYWPQADGERLHPRLGRYHKHTSDTDNERLLSAYPHLRASDGPPQIPVVPRAAVVQRYQPRQARERFVAQCEGGRWRALHDALVDIAGISAEQIGILGSYLPQLDRDADGQQIKDIDFAIYGTDNVARLRERIVDVRAALGASAISAEHVAYHARKFGAHADPRRNSWALTLVNKWSSLQLAPGLLATVRCVHGDEEIGPDPWARELRQQIVIGGRVSGGEGSDFMPRRFQVLAANGWRWQVVSTWWGHQSCVRDGQRVRVYGRVHGDGRTVSITDPRYHGIAIC